MRNASVSSKHYRLSQILALLLSLSTSFVLGCQDAEDLTQASVNSDQTSDQEDVESLSDLDALLEGQPDPKTFRIRLARAF